MIRMEIVIFIFTFVLVIAWYGITLWRVGVTIFENQIFGAWLFAPWACLLRYHISKLNYKIIKWYPLGTYIVNTMACLIDFVL